MSFNINTKFTQGKQLKLFMKKNLYAMTWSVHKKINIRQHIEYSETKLGANDNEGKKLRIERQ